MRLHVSMLTPAGWQERWHTRWQLLVRQSCKHTVSRDTASVIPRQLNGQDQQLLCIQHVAESKWLLLSRLQAEASIDVAAAAAGLG